jgi:hypothetical protein
MVLGVTEIGGHVLPTHTGQESQPISVGDDASSLFPPVFPCSRLSRIRGVEVFSADRFTEETDRAAEGVGKASERRLQDDDGAAAGPLSRLVTA